MNGNVGDADYSYGTSATTLLLSVLIVRFAFRESPKHHPMCSLSGGRGRLFMEILGVVSWGDAIDVPLLRRRLSLS